MPSGVQQAHEIVVGEAGLTDGRLIVNWDDPENEPDVEILDPTGEALTDGVAGVRVYKSDTHREYHLPAIRNGTYQLPGSCRRFPK